MSKLKRFLKVEHLYTVVFILLLFAFLLSLLSAIFFKLEFPQV